MQASQLFILQTSGMSKAELAWSSWGEGDEEGELADCLCVPLDRRAPSSLEEESPAELPSKFAKAAFCPSTTICTWGGGVHCRVHTVCCPVRTGKKSRHACTRNISRSPATHTRAQGMLCESVPDKPTFVVERTKYMKTKCTARTRAMMLLAVRTEAVPEKVVDVVSFERFWGARNARRSESGRRKANLICGLIRPLTWCDVKFTVIQDL